uniref:Short-chain dehydrogenase/reductase family protein n=1 Tax=Mycena chlorophos TaxID=658473 RepID=A0ABQ0L2I6_MYCCL|nr:short-chain dehydrogenase/reductase family protein [Mycena chlorophos]
MPFAFKPTKDIPDLTGKVILVTGGKHQILASGRSNAHIPLLGTAGIGKEAILEYARHKPSKIFFTGRDAARGASVEQETNSIARFVACDMTSLASVQTAAHTILAETERLDIMVFNAGIMNVPPALTKEGYEVHFGVNHVAHALLFKLLLPVLLRTAELPDGEVRIASLSSLGYGMHPSGGILYKKIRTTLGSGLVSHQRYGQSKLANIYLAMEIARRYPQFTAVSVHPGVVQTDLLANLSWTVRTMAWLSVGGKYLTPAEGAYNMLWATTVDKSKLEDGEFYVPVGVKEKRMREGSNAKAAEKLWEWTDEELKPFN